MKKKLLVLSVLALSGISTATLASCNRFSGTTTPGAVVSSKDQGVKTVSGISVSGQNTEYGIGDAIVQGATARVSVNYTDGTSTDGTATASFDFSAVDATKAGTYTVKVTCQGKETSYNVTVNEYVFDGIEVDTTNAKLDYYIYSVYDFSDVVVNSLYKHPVTGEVTKKALNNADVAFNVTDKDGNTVTSQFPAFGTYKVEASYNNAKTSFDVNCVPVDAKTVADAVEAASKAESSVNSGTASNVSILYGEDGGTITTNTDYVYGESYVMTTRLVSMNEGSGDVNVYRKENLYYSLDYNGKIFVVAVPVDDDGEEIKAEAYVPKDIENLTEDDAKYAGFNIFDDGTKCNGLYTAISEFYREITENVVGDLNSSVGKCEHLDNADGFKFSYNRLNSSYNKLYFQKVIVEFTLSDSGAINKAYIQIDDYTSDENKTYSEKDYEAGVPIPSDLPVEIKTQEDEAGQTKKYFVFKEGVDANPAKTEIWTFNQETGKKASNDDNPYLADKVKMSSFDIRDADGKVLNDGEEINIDLDNGNVEKDEGNHRFVYNFTLDNVLPTTALSNVDLLSFNVTGTGKDGYVLGTGTNDSSYAYANKTDSGFTIMFNRPGDYDIVVKSLNVTKTLHYHVDYEAPYTIAGTVHNGEENSSFVPEESFAMFKSNKIYIGANIGDPKGNNPSVFEPGFEATVDKATGNLEKTTVNVNGKDVECYAFTATEAGAYVITLTGAKPDSDRAAATTKLTINVSENPTLESILAKYDNKYEAIVSEDEIYSLEFTDNKFTVYSKYDRTKYAEYDYTYDAENRTFSCIPGSSSGIDKTFELSMSNYYVLSLFDTDEKKNYVLTNPTSDITDEDWSVLKGIYTCEFDSKNYEFEFKQGDEIGEGSFTVKIGSNNYAYTYKYENGSGNQNSSGKLLLTLTNEGDDGLANYTLSVKNTVISLSDGSNFVNLTAKKIDINEILKGTYTASFDMSGNGEYKFEIKFNDDKTATIKNYKTNRERVCSYVYDTETGQLKFTKISGSSNPVGIESATYIIDGQIKYTGIVLGGSPIFTREGDTDSPEEPDVVEIPEEYIGTWYGLDDYDESLVTVVISATSIKVTSVEANETFEVQSINNNVVSAGKLVLTLNKDSIGYNYRNSYITCTLSRENPLGTLEVPSELQGTYVGFHPNLYDYVTIIIDKTKLTYKSEDDNVYDLKSIDGNTYVFADGDFEVKVVVEDDGSIEFTDELDNSFTIKTNAPDETPIEIDDSFIGTWKNDEDTITLVIDASSVKWNDVAATGLAYEGDWLVFNVEQYGNVSLHYNEQKGILDLTYSNQRIELTKQTADAPVEEADYKGTYTNDEYEILFIGTENVVYNEDSYTINEHSKENNVVTVVASMTKRGNEVVITITIENDSVTVALNGDEIPFEKEEEYIAIPDAFVGEWTDGDNNLTITSDFVIFSNGTKTTYIVTSASDKEIEVTDGDVSITYSLVDGKILEDNEYEYTKLN